MAINYSVFDFKCGMKNRECCVKPQSARRISQCTLWLDNNKNY